MSLNEQHIIDELKKGTTPLPGDDYFAQLKSNLMRHTEPVPVIPIYRRLWFVSSAAAACVLLTVSIFVYKGKPTTDNTAGNVNWNSVSREDVLAYIQDNIEEFETEAIAAHLDTIPDWKHTAVVPATDSLGIPHSSKGNSDYEQLFNDLDKEEILKYLQEEAVDIDDEMLLGS